MKWDNIVHPLREDNWYDTNAETLGVKPMVCNITYWGGGGDTTNHTANC
jgi:hypothetical protein